MIAYCEVHEVEKAEDDRACALFREKFPQGNRFGNSRLTLTLPLVHRVHWGITGPVGYTSE